MPTQGPRTGESIQITVEGLGVSYDGHDVLRDVSFSVYRGELLAIVGKSGSGKSSLLLALAGLIPRLGEVDIPGDIGFVFQNYAAFPWMTVRDNIGAGLRRLRHPKREKVADALLRLHREPLRVEAAGYRQKLWRTLALRRIDHAYRRRLVKWHIDLVDLTDHADKYPGQLSGGQVQRVALARALAPNPLVIFLDEPFGALDSYTRDRMQAWLLNVYEVEHKTMLFVTHNVEEAIFLSDRILLLGQGGIPADFSVPFKRPRENSIRYHSDFVRLKQQVAEQIIKCQ